MPLLDPVLPGLGQSPATLPVVALVSLFAWIGFRVLVPRFWTRPQCKVQTPPTPSPEPVPTDTPLALPLDPATTALVSAFQAWTRSNPERPACLSLCASSGYRLVLRHGPSERCLPVGPIGTQSRELQTLRCTSAPLETASESHPFANSPPSAQLAPSGDTDAQELPSYLRESLGYLGGDPPQPPRNCESPQTGPDCAANWRSCRGQSQCLRQTLGLPCPSRS